MKKLWTEKYEHGQSIVIIAVVMVGLIALMGLAIDGGALFMQRREMQSAADAAALSGTRALAEAICGDAAFNDAFISAAINKYAESNGVKDTNSVPGDAINGNVRAHYVNAGEAVIGTVGSGTIPVGSTGISVTVSITYPTYFMAVVGVHNASTYGKATAMTSPPFTGGGLRPVGVPLNLALILNEGDSFTMVFKNCTDNHPENCVINYTGGQAQHHGMMNFGWMWNQGEASTWPRAVDPSGDSNVLKEWMENGFTGALLYADCKWAEGCRYGDYVHAKPGVSSAVIGAAPVGQIAYVPIFDNLPDYNDIPGPKPASANQGGSQYYHIVGFMGFLVTGANQGAGTISGEVTDIILGLGQVSPTFGTGFGENQACTTHTQVISLWK